MHYIYEWVSSQDNLYPAHIFDWNLKVVNCPSEDYSVGGVSDQVFTFTSDHKIDINNYALQIDYLQYYIQNMEHINNSDRWKYTCIAGSHISAPNTSSWDAIIPDSTLEQWAEQTMTLNDLFNAIVGWTDTNSLSVNGNYVINSAFGYTGITKRQVMQWIAQLTGGNVAYKEVPEITTGTHQTITRGGSAELILNPSNVKNIVLSDFTVPQIDRIWFGTDNSDVGVSYGSGVQQLSLPYNPLINPEDDSFLQPLYNSIRSHIPVYTPMKVELFNEAYEYELNGSTYTLDFSSAHTRSVIEKLSSCDNAILPFSEGMRLRYTDANNNTFIAPIFNYELSPRGVTIECTGNPSREVSNALISNEIAQNGKYNKFKRTLDSTVSEIANLQGDVSTLTQTANSLTTQVAGKVGKDEVISSINQTAETITINANKINLVGAVTFSDLDSSTQNTINDKTSSSDVTTIIGNTVNAAYINALEINAKKIVSTYTITWDHSDYSSSDLTTLQSLITSGSWTETDLERYDVNLDGTLTGSDLIIIRNMINNGTDYTASIKTEIDPSKPSRPICIYNGNTAKTYLSANAVVSPSGSFNRLSVAGDAAYITNGGFIYSNDSSGQMRAGYNGIEFFDANGNSKGSAAIVQTGTSSDWTYRKWSDGTYECWKTIPYSQRVEGVWDDDFYVEVNAQSYPVTFASAPYEVVSISSGDKSLFIANTSTGPSTTKTAKYLFMRPTNAGTTITVNLTFYVKGVLP